MINKTSKHVPNAIWLAELIREGSLTDTRYVRLLHLEILEAIDRGTLDPEDLRYQAECSNISSWG